MIEKEHMHDYRFYDTDQTMDLNCLYIYVYDWLFVGFSLLSGASDKALNFSQILVDSALSRVYHPSVETRSGQRRSSHLSLSDN